MSPQLISFLLFIPFLALTLPIGLIYLRAGYQKGLFRSLLSLAVSVVSIIISYFAADFLSDMIAGALVGIIPTQWTEELGFFRSYALIFAEGMIKIVIATVIFALLLFLFLIVLKLVANRIPLPTPSCLDPEKKLSRWTGLAVRLVDTLLVALFLSLPLYGVLANALPPISGIVRMTVKDHEIVSYLDSVENHSLLALYRNAPISWVSDGLASFSFHDAPLNINEVAQSVEGLVTRFNNLTSASEEDKEEATKELLQYTKDHIIGEEWCYELVITAKESISAELENIEDETVRREAQQVLEFLDFDREGFVQVAESVLTLGTHIFDSDVQEALSNQNFEALPDSTTEELGELLNCDETVVQLKKMLLQEAAKGLYSQDHSSEEAARMAQELMDQSFSDGVVGEESRDEEARAFLQILSAESPSELREAFALHPLFSGAF